MRKTVCASVLCISLLGCATPSNRSLVFGLYDVPAESLVEVKQAGFDVVTGPPDSDFLQAAAAAKVQVLLSSSAFAGNNKVKDELAKFDHHPATWGWYLIDEPDLHDIAPRRVARVTQSFQQRATKPGVVVVASGIGARNYGAEADLLLVDFYPIPWSPLGRFAKEMRLASFARNGKPYMAVVQAFDWSHFPEVLGQTNDLRLPTIAEIRCMSYSALALDAKGIFFYSFQAGSWNLPNSPLWPELTNMVHELRRHSPLFERESIWWPTEVEYGDPARMYNEVHESAILSRLYHLPVPAAGFPPGYYFLFINTTGEPLAFDVKLPFANVRRIRQHGPRNEIAINDGWLRRTYEPFEVSIFGPIQEKPLFEN